MANRGFPAFRMALQEIETLLEAMSFEEEGAGDQSRSTIERKLIYLPYIRSKDPSEANPQLLESMRQLLGFLEIYLFDTALLSCMVEREMEKLYEQHGMVCSTDDSGVKMSSLIACTMMLIISARKSFPNGAARRTPSSNLPINLPIIALSCGNKEQSLPSTYPLPKTGELPELMFDGRMLYYRLIVLEDGVRKVRYQDALPLYHFIQVVHVRSKVAFVPEVWKGFVIWMVEARSPQQMAAFLYELRKVTSLPQT